MAEMSTEVSLPLDNEHCKRRNMRRSVKSLAESIQSLLGFKKNLTSSWAQSVCDIIKDLPYGEPSACPKLKNPMDDSLANQDDEMVKLQDELAALIAHLDCLIIQRRHSLNDYLDLKGNIRVFCRIRPILVGEEFNNFGSVILLDSNDVLLNFADNKRNHYSFDKVFHPGSSQDEVFAEVEPVIKSALDGYNACIFAYGQTGTGKTFTMEGKPGCPGVVPRAIEALIRQGLDSNHKFMFSFSMLEIYLGGLRDLLNPETAKPTYPTTQCLSIQMEPNGGVQIENLVSIRVNDFNQVKRLYRIGSRLRSTSSTNSNGTSSRSHCMIRISVTCSDAPERRRETNKIWMVDLGGSERLVKTKARGRRFEEGRAINLSLSALGDVISALQQKKSHVPYRNSKLTQILRDSLGEDSKTLMLVHVSPKESDLCETVCSLSFATRVRSIHLGHKESPAVRAKKEAAMAELLEKVKKLEYECQQVTIDIQKLKENLNHLTRTNLPSNVDSDFLHLSNELPDDLKMEHPRNKEVTGGSSLRLPRFMRSTVCSRQKTDTDCQFLERAKKKVPVLAERRKVASKSVTFPLKGILNSENESDFSASRSSFLGGRNWKYSVDSETELSRDASECEIKMVIFPEKEKSSWSLDRSKDHVDNATADKSGNKRADKDCFENFSTVEMWIQLQKFEPAQTCIPQSKRVHAVPVPEKKSICTDQNISVIVTESEILPCVFTENLEIVESQSFNNGNCEKVCDDKFKGGNDHNEQLLDGRGNVNIATESSETGAMCDSPQLMEYISLYSEKAIPKALFAADKHAETHIPMIEFHAENPNAGICFLLRKTVRILLVSALLGLGVQSLGFEHEFFHGLMF